MFHATKYFTLFALSVGLFFSFSSPAAAQDVPEHSDPADLLLPHWGGSQTTLVDDFDDDGVPDFIIQDWPEWAMTRLVSGATGALLDSHYNSRNHSQTPHNDYNRWAYHNSKEMKSVGDMNGDGKEEFAFLKINCPTAACNCDHGSCTWERLDVASGPGDSSTGFDIMGYVNPAGNFYGWDTSLESVGDIDGDGLDDLAIGSEHQGRVDFFKYNGSGLELIDSIYSSDPEATLSVGRSVIGVGDLNGDGHDDFLLGMPAAEDDKGQVRAFSGATREILQVFDGAIVEASSVDYLGSDLILRGQTAGDQFGFDIDNCGDIDQNGVVDVIIGAPGGRYAKVIDLVNRVPVELETVTSREDKKLILEAPGLEDFGQQVDCGSVAERITSKYQNIVVDSKGNQQGDINADNVVDFLISHSNFSRVVMVSGKRGELIREFVRSASAAFEPMIIGKRRPDRMFADILTTNREIHFGEPWGCNPFGTVFETFHGGSNPSAPGVGFPLYTPEAGYAIPGYYSSLFEDPANYPNGGPIINRPYPTLNLEGCGEQGAQVKLVADNLSLLNENGTPTNYILVGSHMRQPEELPGDHTDPFFGYTIERQEYGCADPTDLESCPFAETQCKLYGSRLHTDYLLSNNCGCDFDENTIQPPCCDTETASGIADCCDSDPESAYPACNEVEGDAPYRMPTYQLSCSTHDLVDPTLWFTELDINGVSFFLPTPGIGKVTKVIRNLDVTVSSDIPGVDEAEFAPPVPGADERQWANIYWQILETSFPRTSQGQQVIDFLGDIACSDSHEQRYILMD